MVTELKIDYAIYGNFYFKQHDDDDVDVLINKNDQQFVKQYLDSNSINYHERSYYPNQIFITGTDIKVHITDDLYLGGRRVQYLMKLGLTDRVFMDRKPWDSVYIIDFISYRRYRLIKNFLNSNKAKKLDEHPLKDDKMVNYSKNGVFILASLLVVKNFFLIPYRLLNKHLWVKLSR